MSGGDGASIHACEELPFCDSWLEAKYKLSKLLFRLGLKNNCGKASFGTGMWTVVW